jgi:hypothetical protein
MDFQLDESSCSGIPFPFKYSLQYKWVSQPAENKSNKN